MDIEAYKLELINRINQLDDISVFTQIKSILDKYSERKVNQNAEQLPVELLLKLIKQSGNEYKEGKITTNEDFEKETISW
ncbi:MAG: hypothetical protein DRJ10_17675 [Bacteroidetes bacterium]|nr:MAG: hypothetical protein DRJ10_17675 [Bacteroidota bacterium]